MDSPTFTPEQLARIHRIRAEIAAGTYDTPGRLEAALQKLVERLETGEPAPPGIDPLRSAKPR